MDLCLDFSYKDLWAPWGQGPLLPQVGQVQLPQLLDKACFFNWLSQPKYHLRPHGRLQSPCKAGPLLWRRPDWRDKGADSLVTRCGGRRALRKYGENREVRETRTSLSASPAPLHPHSGAASWAGVPVFQPLLLKNKSPLKLWFKTTTILLCFLVSARQEFQERLLEAVPVRNFWHSCHQTMRGWSGWALAGHLCLFMEVPGPLHNALPPPRGLIWASLKPGDFRISQSVPMEAHDGEQGGSWVAFYDLTSQAFYGHFYHILKSTQQHIWFRGKGA